ncbi:hypothetical protein AAC387_Pa03g4023 [Persea americana]
MENLKEKGEELKNFFQEGYKATLCIRTGARKQWSSGIVTTALSQTLAFNLSRPLPISKTLNPLPCPPHQNCLRSPLSVAATSFPHDAIEGSVDSFPFKIPKGFTVLGACEVAGADIPHFCHHSCLSIVRNQGFGDL